jgi:MFS family permease
VALPLLAASLTRRPILIAGLLFVECVPALLLAIPAGAYADRVDGRRLMRRMDVARGALLVGLAAVVALGDATIALIYGFGLAVGVCETFFVGAAQGAVPEIVGEPQLEQANGLLMIGGSVGEETIGPALGGLLFSWSKLVPFAGDAASFFGSAALLFGMGREPQVSTPERLGLAVTLSGVWTDAKGGLTWYRQSRALRLVTATVATLAFCQAMVYGILVLFVLHRLHVDRTGYGIFMAAVAVGNIVGGIVATRVIRRLATASALVVVALLAGAAYLGAGATSSPYAAGLFLALEAVAVVVGNVAAISFRQRVTPPEMQARVATVWRSVVWGAVPVGVLVGGVLGAVLGLQWPFYVAGGAQLLLAVVVARPLRRLLSTV